jgi:PAS domain S-box-containing protein
MKDENKTKGQLVNELAELRQRVAALEALEAERKQAEEALRDSEERFRRLSEAAFEAIAIHEGGVVLSANDQFFEMFGYEPDELLGKQIIPLIVAPEAGEFMRKQIATGGLGPYESIGLREDGTKFPIEIQVREMEYEGRKVRVGAIMDITERKQAEEALRRSLEETARGQRTLLALSQAAQTVQRARTPEEVYQTIGDEVARLGYHALIFTLTDDRVHLAISHHTFEPALLRAAEKLAGRSAQGYQFPLMPGGFFQRIIAEEKTCFTEQTAKYIAETLPEPLRPLAGRLAALLGLEQSIVAPLTVGGETNGLLAAFGRDLNEADVPAMTAFANQAAIALENAQLYEAEQKRRSIAETLRQVSTVLSSTLELKEILELILQQLRQVIPYDTTSIQLLQDRVLNSPKGEHLEIAACRGFEEPDKVVGLVFPLDPKFPNYRVVTTQAPLAIEDITQDYPHFKGEADRYESGHIRSWLGVPLMVKDQVIGMIAMDQAEVRPYSAEEAQLAMAFANQAALAIENARLYQMKGKRAAQLAVVSQVARRAASILDMEQLLQEVVAAIQQGFQYHHVTLDLLDEAVGELEVRAVVGGFADIIPPGYRQAVGEGITGWTAETGQPLLANDVSQEPRYIPGFLEEPLTQSELCVPLKLVGQVIGVLDIQSTCLNAFDQTDLMAMETLADQLAVAIENAQLYQETVRRLKETETLSAVTTTLTRSLDLDQVLHSIVASAVHLIPAGTGGVIHLVDEATGRLVPWATLAPEINAREKYLEMSTGEGIAGLAVQEKQLINVPNVEEDPRFLTVDTASAKKSLLTVPLLMDEDCIGTLSLNSDQVGAFSADDEWLLTTLAAQAAVAVKNARLYEQAQAHSHYLETLQRINATLRSTLPLSQVLEMIAQGAGKALNYVGSLILIPDATGKRLTLGAMWGSKFLDATVKLTGLRVEAFSLPLTAKENPMAQAYLSRELQAWSGAPGRIVVGVEPAISPKLAPVIARAMGAQGAACLPLPVGEKMVGVLVALSPRQQFTDEERAMLLGLADQAGLAIENARLYEQARQDAETKTTLLNEVNHRARNNLSAIVGLLYTERRYAATEEQAVYQSIIQKMYNRVQGLATVHSLLSASEWTPLSLSELTAQVVRSSLQALPHDKSVFIEVPPSPVRVRPDQAHDLALIINELATNTVQHALQERDTANITARIGLDDDMVRLEFRDDGPGYPEEVLRLERHNVGFYLIQRMVHRTLRGELTLHNDRGAVATIRFKTDPLAFGNPKGLRKGAGDE